MKLLIYSHYFAPSVGGVETIVQSLARGLAGLRNASGEAEFEVSVITQTAGEKFDDASLPFRVIRRPSFVHLWDAIRDSDAVHVAGPALAPVLLAILAGKPLFIEHHGFQTICPNGQLLIEPAGAPCPGHFMAGQHGECLRCNSGMGWFAARKLWLLTFVRRFLARRASKNITPTAWLGSLLKLPNEVAIPHGLETISEPLHHRPVEGRTPIVAFQGRLVTTKGVAVLFDAARILLEQNHVFELLIIGDGPERAELEKLAQASPLGGHVRFTGRLSGPVLDDVLAGADVVVVPSLGGEVFGLVVAENMLRALPVVASDLGAFVEVIGAAGRTFPTGDAAALAKELDQLLENRRDAAELGRLARQRALVFCDFRRMVDAHAQSYREARS